MKRTATLEECARNGEQIGETDYDMSVREMCARIFDFDYDMPEDYKCIFEYKFFKRYRYHPINYDSFAMWKNQLESNLLELLPRYNKLYESEHMILNPFLNYISRYDSFTDNAARNKTYNVNNGEALHNNESKNASMNTGLDIGNTNGNNTTASSSDNVSKTKGMNDEDKTHTNLYTDSPQSQKANEKIFNDGYITTAAHDKYQQAAINSSTSTAFDKSGSVSTSTNTDNRKTYSDNVGEGTARDHNLYYSDGYAVASSRGTIKNAIEESGLKGVTVSTVINEWRSTFINIDRMLLDEMKILFLKSY